jgi:serine/threonine protein kinase
MLEEVLLAFSLEHQRTVVVKMFELMIPAMSPVGEPPSHDFKALPRRAGQGGSSVTRRKLMTAQRAAMVVDLHRLTELRHPNLLMLFDVFDEPDAQRLYLVQEYADGGCVASLMPNGASNVTIGLHLLIPMMSRVASALAYLHTHGIAHRNLCPENIFASTDGRILLSGSGLPPDCSRHSLPVLDPVTPISQHDADVFIGISDASPPPSILDAKHHRRVLESRLAADIRAMGITIRALWLGNASDPLSPSPPRDVTSLPGGGATVRHRQLQVPRPHLTSGGGDSPPSVCSTSSALSSSHVHVAAQDAASDGSEASLPHPSELAAELHVLVDLMTRSDEKRRPSAIECRDRLAVLEKRLYSTITMEKPKP